MSKYTKCPICRQDLRAKPHDGEHGRNCQRCGQGINWKREQKRKHAARAHRQEGKGE
jgi:hypothetical protein